MKKSMVRLVTAAVMLMSAVSLPLSASAQKGEKTLGFAGGYASHNNGGYADIYFQYTFSKHVRIAPELGYIFRHQGKSAFECSVDMQFPFRVERAIHVYPLAGLTFNNWNYSHGDHSASHAGFDFGGGFDINLTTSMKLTIQAKYSLMNDTSGAFVGMGLGYIF